MNTIAAASIAGVSIALTQWAATAETIAAASDQFEMRPLDSIETQEPVGQVIGGNPQNSADWPATFVFVGLQDKSCTATVVGRRTVLTAAHCVKDGGSGSLQAGKQRIHITCSRHPDYLYPERPSADFSLCLSDSIITGFRYEKVDISESTQVGEKLFLLGYGCIDITGTASMGALYGGPAEVISRPEADLYTVTRGGPAICGGDSGGGAFTVAKARRLIGVNSQGNYKTESQIATTATSAFSEWARSWAAKRSTELCGISEAASNCRGD
jgi:Trypsin